jgi:hypothetical protein
MWAVESKSSAGVSPAGALLPLETGEFMHSRESLVWLVAEARLEWFCLEDDEYRLQEPDAQGVLHSRVFPGLRLPVAPVLACDTAKVLAALTDQASH